MKQSDFKYLINECVREVLAEGRHSKKAKAIKAIREIITENELTEEDIAEMGNVGTFIKKAVGLGPVVPPTDEEINKYLASRPKDKEILDKDPKKKAKWLEFVKADKNAGKAIKKLERVLAVWDNTKQAYSAQASNSNKISPTSFGLGERKSY